MTMLVPAAVVQLREGMISPSENANVKFNYYQSMLRVKEYADKACAEFERKNKRR